MITRVFTIELDNIVNMQESVTNILLHESITMMIIKYTLQSEGILHIEGFEREE